MGGDLAVIANARHCLGHRVGVLVDGEDFGALACEQDRGGAPVAPAWPDAAGPDYKSDLVRNPSCHAFPPLSERADVRA